MQWPSRSASSARGYLSQSWHMMTEGDNPPVGLLLCTGKDQALVQYATASIDNRLFVSKYEVALPSRQALEQFMQAQRLALLGHD
ncbi:MAG: DUF1016 family protein [Rhodoferax sp.]|nr:DUF1016 family protein [Rhodoferax sp.]